MTSKVIQILDKPEHDEIVATSKDIPTVIYVSNSSLPVCRTFQSTYEKLAEKWAGEGVRSCQLEFTSKTSMMFVRTKGFKFSPNQLPVTVFMVHDNWCKTVMGADVPAMDSAVESLLHEAKRS